MDLELAPIATKIISNYHEKYSSGVIKDAELVLKDVPPHRLSSLKQFSNSDLPIARITRSTTSHSQLLSPINIKTAPKILKTN